MMVEGCVTRAEDSLTHTVHAYKHHTRRRMRRMEMRNEEGEKRRDDSLSHIPA
jgi:hypothetical protein